MANRQARSPGGIQQFDSVARVSGDVPGWAVEGGQAFRALAELAGGIGDRLGKLADKAAAREGEMAGLGLGASSGAAYLQQQAAQAGADGKAGSSWRDAIASIESKGSGGYAAVGPRNAKLGRALGRYQIMEANIGPWSREALGRAVSADEFMRDPSIQDAVFDHKFGGYVKKFGLEGAAQAWFAGPGGVGKVGRTDLLGTDVGSYGKRFVAALGAAPRNAPPSAPIVATLPTEPLQLRRDGTIYGEAYDRAAMNAYVWRMQAGVSNAIQAAYEANPDDPGALAGALAQVQDQFSQDPNLADPELREAFAKNFTERSETYLRSARAKAETKMREEERVATFDGMAAQRLDVERQAVALGANPEGDRIIEREVTRAGRAIDAAVASGAISPADGAKQKEELGTTAALGRARGVYEALETPEEKEQFATALLDDWKEGKGPVAQLPYAKVKALSTTLWSAARQERNQKTAEERIEAERLKGRLNDDIASVEATGQGLADIDPGTVSDMLGPEGLASWSEKREVASRVWGATAGMETETGEEISERLAALAPQAGSEGFRDQERVYEAAATKAQAIVKARADDPAAAAEAAFPEVAQLSADAAVDDPVAMQALIAARLQAQDALGLDEFSRQPLKKAEALSLARAVTQQHEPRAQAQAMADLVDQVNAAYGPHADAVLRQVLEARGMDKDMAAYGAGLFARMNRGGRPTTTDARQGGVISETAAASAAGEPRVTDAAPVANYEQQQMLLTHPELASQYDEKFGNGAAQRVLGRRRGPTDPLVTHEDGGTARINEGGSEDWTPDR